MSSESRKWKFRLRHIIEAIQRINTYLSGMSFAQFKADAKTVDAVIRNLIIIGEAARHNRVIVDSESRLPKAVIARRLSF